MNENRYINLKRQNPERAEELFDRAANDAKKKFEALTKRSL